LQAIVANQLLPQLCQRHIRLHLQTTSQLLTRFVINAHCRPQTIPPLRRYIASLAIQPQNIFHRRQADLKNFGYLTLRLRPAFARLNNSPTQIHGIRSRHDDTSAAHQCRYDSLVAQLFLSICLP